MDPVWIGAGVVAAGLIYFVIRQRGNAPATRLERLQAAGADYIEEHRRHAVGFDPAGRRVLFDSPKAKREFAFDDVRSCEGSGSAITQSAFFVSMTTRSHWVDFNVRCPETPIIRVPVSSQTAAARICEWFRLMDEGALPVKREPTQRDPSFVHSATSVSVTQP